MDAVLVGRPAKSACVASETRRAGERPQCGPCSTPRASSSTPTSDAPPLGRRRRGDGGGIRVHRSGARPGHQHPDLPRAHGARRAARGGAGCPGRARREPRRGRAGAGRHRARRRGHRVARRAGRDRRRVPGGGVGRVHRGSARGSRRHQPDAPARLCRGMSRESTPTTPGRGTVPVATPGLGRSGDATVVTDSDANQRLAAGIRTGGVEGASEQFPHRGLRG